jgi:hypothetical protein
VLPGICVASLEFGASKCVVSTARKTHPPCWSPLDDCGNYKCKNRPRYSEPVYLSSHVNRRSFLISPSSIRITRVCAAQPETFISSPRLPSRPHISIAISRLSQSGQHSLWTYIPFLSVLFTSEQLEPYYQDSPSFRPIAGSLKFCCSCLCALLKLQLDYSSKELRWTSDYASNPTTLAKAIFTMQPRG